MNEPLEPTSETLSVSTPEPDSRTGKGSMLPVVSFLLSAVALVLILFHLLTSDDEIPPKPEESQPASNAVAPQASPDLRFEALERSIAELDRKSSAPVTPSPISESIDALQSAIVKLQQTADEQGASLRSLANRINRLEFNLTVSSKEEETAPEETNRQAELLETLEARLNRLEQDFDAQLEVFSNHTHSVELRDHHKGWNLAFPGWASDYEGLRFDTSERRITRPLQFGSENTVWSQNGLGAGTTQREKR